MRKRRKPVRIFSAAMAMSLFMTGLYPGIAYAADGFSEMVGLPTPELANSWTDYTFSSEAEKMAAKYGVVPTGLALYLTNTHRYDIVEGYPEPFWYGKWWVADYKGMAKERAVPVAGENGNKALIDFSKVSYHFTSCIQDHKSDHMGNTLEGNGTRGTKREPYGTQFFANEAYYPGDSAANYPLYLQSINDEKARKFYLLLMCGMHSVQPSDVGYGDNEAAMKDDYMATVYSMLTFAMTISFEESDIGQQIHSADELFAHLKNSYSQQFMTGYAPNKMGTNYYEYLFGTLSEPLQRWFHEVWNNAMFMSQFTYKMEPGADGNCDLIANLPLTEPTLGSDGRYHRTWDYSEFAAKYPDIARTKNAALTLYTTGPSALFLTNQNNVLDIAADTAEDFEREMPFTKFVLKDQNTEIDNNQGVTGPTPDNMGKNSGNNLMPGGLIGGRYACIFTDDATGQAVDMASDGQLRFIAYTKELELKGEAEVRIPEKHPDMARYKHTETFSADYNVRLKKFDSETGEPLEKSYWDILEEFPDAKAQLDATELEDEANWGNDSGSQFTIWDGWDYGDGNPEGDPANDPCSNDFNATNDNGDLSYDNGKIAHSDTKYYTYTKGYCGGHPAQPQPIKDPETDETINQDEIDNWNEELETCQKLIEESSTGYFCATVENGYIDGEDEDGSLSRAEMEEDRDNFYEQFISLKYKYSATEVQARQGYTIHRLHTDDIPIETKTVTSSQYKDFNDSCNGNVGSLPHRDTPASGSNKGSDDGDEESLFLGTEEEGTADASGQTAKGAVIVTASDAEKAAVQVSSKGSASGTEASDDGSTGSEENAYLQFLSGLEEDAETLEDAESADSEKEEETAAAEDDASETTAEDETEEIKEIKETEAIEAAEETEGTESLDSEIAEETQPEIGRAVIETYSNADRDTATASNAFTAEKESWFAALYEKAQAMADKFYQMLHGAWDSFISMFARDDDDDDSGSGSHPVRDSVTWTDDEEGNYIDPLTSDIVDHTFTVFDHRTEGEIHINKRDLDLRRAENDDTYDAYADENGDGTLEGAVYGLFAKRAIEHPDGHTGTVYQKDDLVAVATTDRNGDASFMTFTEAPGMTYDYEQGAVVKRTDSPFNGPDNLHKSEAAGDAVAEDNEAYIGYDSNNNKVTIEDSEAGNNTVYYKHSSNQDGIEGLEGGHETYPILNNEDNNGNCWIGRPLIAGTTGTQYYIKELSRSEGYELSVSGKTNAYSNGADSWDVAPSAMHVTIGSKTNIGVSTEMPVTATNVDGDVTLKVKTSKGASFASVSTKKEDYVGKEYVTVPVLKKVYASDGEKVQLNGQYIEASVGDTITVNGTAYTVTKVSDAEQATIGAVPANTTVRTIVQKTTLDSADYEDFKNKFNNELKDLKYKTPDAHAPWIRVPLVGTSDTDWIGAINSAMTDQGLLYFNAARITDIITENGVTYAVIRYNYATGDKVESCIYNTERDSLYIKQDTTAGDFVYVEIPVSSDIVKTVTRNDTGFVTVASLKKFTMTCDTVYPAELPTSYTLTVENPKTYWVYDGKMQKFNDDGTLATWKILIFDNFSYL